MSTPVGHWYWHLTNNSPSQPRAWQLKFFYQIFVKKYWLWKNFGSYSTNQDDYQISSFQLEKSSFFNPKISVLLNFLTFGFFNKTRWQLIHPVAVRCALLGWNFVFALLGVIYKQKRLIILKGGGLRCQFQSQRRASVFKKIVSLTVGHSVRRLAVDRRYEFAFADPLLAGLAARIHLQRRWAEE